MGVVVEDGTGEGVVNKKQTHLLDDSKISPLPRPFRSDLCCVDKRGEDCQDHNIQLKKGGGLSFSVLF